jgi:DNA-binding transcriptional ArsR family regulator
MKSQSDKKSFSQIKKKSAKVALLLKQLSHPQRLLILCSLFEGEKSVSEIEKLCGASQSSVSQFLKMMKLEGLVQGQRKGKQIYYSIKDESIRKLMSALFEIFC